MQAARRQAEDHVAGRHLGAGQQALALGGTDGEPGQVVVAGRVHARHFRRFAADQSTSRLDAPFGDAFDDFHAFFR